MCDQLKKTELGFRHPENDLPRMQKKLDQREIAAKLVRRDRGECVLMFVKSRKPQLWYQCLNLEYCDSSNCRKAVRNVVGGKLSFSEHFRFDCEVGLEIPPELITVKRPDVRQKLAEDLEDPDKFVCSIEKQKHRQETRRSVLNYIEQQSGFSCAKILRDEIDAKFDFRDVVVRKSVRMQVERPKQSKRGRPAQKEPEVRSRKKSLSSRPRKKAKLWDLKVAVERVKGLAAFIGSKGTMPTRKSFSMQGELHLWRLIFETRKWGTPAKFAQLCQLEIS